MISNVTIGDDIAVSVSWSPPADPNGIITFYRVRYEEVSDLLNNVNNGQRKRNSPLDRGMDIFSNNTGGNTGPSTSVTLTGLG